MIPSHVQKIAQELGLKPSQVEAVAGLLQDGSTIPFIARYRKEATGMLDEVLIYNRVLSRAEISSLFRKEQVVAGTGALKAARAAEAAANPAPPPPAEPVPSPAETRAPAVEEAAKAAAPPAAPAASPSPDAAAMLSQEALYCCEKLQQLTREWEKGNTQKVMGMLDELTGGR